MPDLPITGNLTFQEDAVYKVADGQTGTGDISVGVPSTGAKSKLLRFGKNPGDLADTRPTLYSCGSRELNVMTERAGATAGNPTVFTVEPKGDPGGAGTLRSQIRVSSREDGTRDGSTHFLSIETSGAIASPSLDVASACYNHTGSSLTVRPIGFKFSQHKTSGGDSDYAALTVLTLTAVADASGPSVTSPQALFGDLDPSNGGHGSSSAPVLSFIGDADTGLYAAASNGNAMTLCAGGIDLLRVVGGASPQVRLNASGSSSSPMLSFLGDENTGLWSKFSDVLGFSAGGVDLLNIAGGAGPQVRLYSGGSANSPGLAFLADTDTGFWSLASNVLGVAAGGVERLRINGTSAGHTELSIQKGDTRTGSWLNIGFANIGETYVGGEAFLACKARPRPGVGAGFFASVDSLTGMRALRLGHNDGFWFLAKSGSITADSTTLGDTDTKAFLGDDGRLAIGGAGEFGSGAGPMIHLKPATTIPSGPLVAGGILFIQPDGALRFLKKDGSYATIVPTT